MEGGNARCPKCGEGYSYMILDDHLTLTRRSVPIGFTGEAKRTFDPIKVEVDKTTAPRASSVIEAYREVRAEVGKLSNNEQLKVWAHIGRRFEGFSSAEILSAFEGGQGIGHCLIIFSALHCNLVAQSDLYWAWYMIGLDLREVGESDLAKTVFLRALTYTNSPNAVAWNLIQEYFPEVNWSSMNMTEKKSKVDQLVEQQTAKIPSSPDELLMILQTSEEERAQEQEKRSAEEAKRREDRRKSEEQRRAKVQEQRKSLGQCVMCGNSLGFFLRLFGKDRHGKCTEFRE